MHPLLSSLIFNFRRNFTIFNSLQNLICIFFGDNPQNKYKFVFYPIKHFE